MSQSPKIFDAVESGDLAQVRLLLNSDSSQVHATFSRDLPDLPLHVAAQQGHHDIAKLLIAYGAKIDARGDRARTPLHYAAEYGDAAMVNLLVENRADVEARDMSGWTPLYTASRLANPECREVAAFLLEKGAKLDLHSAVCLGKMAEAESMLRTSNNLVATDPLQESLVLEWALTAFDQIQDENEKRGGGSNIESSIVEQVVAKNKRVLDLLVQHGAPITRNALHFAVQRPFPEIIMVLLSYQPRLDDATDAELLEVAKNSRCSETIIDLLLKYKSRTSQ